MEDPTGDISRSLYVLIGRGLAWTRTVFPKPGLADKDQLASHGDPDRGFYVAEASPPLSSRDGIPGKRTTLNCTRARRDVFVLRLLPASLLNAVQSVRSEEIKQGEDSFRTPKKSSLRKPVVAHQSRRAARTMAWASRTLGHFRKITDLSALARVASEHCQPRSWLRAAIPQRSRHRLFTAGR
jgi:hypothetical protein